MSYLSTKIKDLFDISTHKASDKNLIFVKQVGAIFVLDDVRISDVLLRRLSLGDEVIKDDGWYRNIVGIVSPVFDECRNVLIESRPESFKPFFEWMTGREIFCGKFYHFQTFSVERQFKGVIVMKQFSL